MGDFETIDYIFIVIVILSTLFGLARGFIKEIFTVANLMLATLFTYYFFPYSYDFFAKQFTSDTMILAFSIFGVFIVAWIIIALVNSFLIDALGAGKGKGLDRLLGVAFGLLRGALIVISIYLGIVMGYKAQEDEKNLPEWMANAKTHNFVKMQSETFLELMPEKFQTIYKSGSEDLVNNVVESLSPNGLMSDEERKMLDHGLTLKNINTLKEVMGQIPPSFDRILDFYDLSKLKKNEFKKYVQGVLGDYDNALSTGKIQPTIAKNDVESLKKSVNDIEEEKEDLYKGVY